MPSAETKKATKTPRAAQPTSPSEVDRSIRELVQVARLLSDETRLRILFLLAQHGELHVTDLCGRMGQSQPAVSHHLALMRVSGLIESRREAKHNYYCVSEDAVGQMLESFFKVSGDIPKKIKFDDFTLTYQGK